MLWGIPEKGLSEGDAEVLGFGLGGYSFRKLIENVPSKKCKVVGFRVCSGFSV